MLKTCRICNRTKDIKDFVKDKAKKDGYRGYCRECLNLKNRKTSIKPIPKEGYKYCACCNEELSFESFNMRSEKHFSYCKLCEREKDNNRYEHVCSSCGKVYKSGKKDSKICLECHHIIFAEIGKKSLKILNANQCGINNGMFGVHRFGENNPNYNSNKTEAERDYERLLEGYTPWRKQVYKRDNYTCQCCGDSKGGNLNAHHLDAYCWCKEKRIDVNNAVTLCDSCHKQFHKNFGIKHNTRSQFEQFKNNIILEKRA